MWTFLSISQTGSLHESGQMFYLLKKCGYTMRICIKTVLPWKYILIPEKKTWTYLSVSQTGSLHCNDFSLLSVNY